MRVSEYFGATVTTRVKCGLLERRRDAGLFAECERGTHLDAACAQCERLPQLVRFTVRSTHPEGQAEIAYGLEVWRVAQAIHRLAVAAQRHRAARRRIVPAGRRPFDHEAV